jgi:tetratricopeptide (TPR) repeat protein
MKARTVSSSRTVCSSCLRNDADENRYICYKIAVNIRPQFRATIFLPCFLLAGALFTTQSRSFAHGDLHEQNAALTTEIIAHPKRAELYLQRAELHRLHGEWAEALADCQRAESLKTDLISARLLRGKILFGAGKFTEARIALDQFLQSEAKNSDGFLTRARVLVKLEKFELAATDFSKAIQFANIPEPDLYLERAAAWQAAGKLQTALAGVDEGVSKLGAIASLEIPAIELELRLQRYDNALHRIDLLSGQSQRKETWLLKRGEVLEKAQRFAEAKEAYAKTAEVLAQLPLRYKQSEATKHLEIQLAAAQKRLN